MREKMKSSVYCLARASAIVFQKIVRRRPSSADDRTGAFIDLQVLAVGRSTSQARCSASVPRRVCIGVSRSLKPPQRVCRVRSESSSAPPGSLTAYA